MDGYGAVVRVGEPKLGYRLRHGFPIFTKIYVGGMEVEKGHPKNIGTWGACLQCG